MRGIPDLVVLASPVAVAFLVWLGVEIKHAVDYHRLMRRTSRGPRC